MNDPEQCVQDALRPFVVDTIGIAGFPSEEASRHAAEKCIEGVDLSVEVCDVLRITEAVN